MICLNFNRWRSGVDTALYEIVRELSRRHRVTVFASTVDPEASVEGVEFVILPTIPVYRLLIQFATLAAAWWLYRALRHPEREFDVIYATTPVLGGADAAMVQFSSADYLPEILTRPPEGRRARAWVRWGYATVLNAVMAVFDEAAFRRAARTGRPILVPASQGVISSIERRHGRLPRAAQISNPIDVFRFRPGAEPELLEEIRQKTGWGSDAFYLLFVGGDWRRKGLADAVKALRLLPDRVKLIVVGRGDVKAFSSLAESAGAASRVHFAGVRRDVERFYRVAHAFVLPSSYETQGNVCAEAAASGLPVILYNFHGAAELVSEGVNGHIVGNPTAIAERIQPLLEDPDERKRMCVEARNSAARYSPSSVVDRLEGVFREIVLGREAQIRRAQSIARPDRNAR